MAIQLVAIKMVNMARSFGIALNVTDIFQNPSLATLADIARRDSVQDNDIALTAYDGPVEQSSLKVDFGSWTNLTSARRGMFL